VAVAPAQPGRDLVQEHAALIGRTRGVSHTGSMLVIAILMATSTSVVHNQAHAQKLEARYFSLNDRNSRWEDRVERQYWH
jgi:hypothetical protein